MVLYFFILNADTTVKANGTGVTKTSKTDNIKVNGTVKIGDTANVIRYLIIEYKKITIWRLKNFNIDLWHKYLWEILRSLFK